MGRAVAILLGIFVLLRPSVVGSVGAKTFVKQLAEIEGFSQRWSQVIGSRCRLLDRIAKSNGLRASLDTPGLGKIMKAIGAEAGRGPDATIGPLFEMADAARFKNLAAIRQDFILLDGRTVTPDFVLGSMRKPGGPPTHVIEAFSSITPGNQLRKIKADVDKLADIVADLTKRGFAPPASEIHIYGALQGAARREVEALVTEAAKRTKTPPAAIIDSLRDVVGDLNP